MINIEERIKVVEDQLNEGLISEEEYRLAIEWLQAEADSEGCFSGRTGGKDGAVNLNG